MATASQWVAGARPRTLPAAFSPVIAGTGAALFAGGADVIGALLCLVVSLALQIGVNYANDYSDGIRGTDANRVGPMRLVGSGVAEPSQVKRAAFISFAVAAVAGLILVVLTQYWWFIAVGALAIAAAWFYTGGKRPYGYAGLGEVMVFLFFGVVAVNGTTYVQLGTVTGGSLWASVAVGALATAVLVTNNLRDIDGDTDSGKRTLATRLGDERTRWLYLVLCLAAGLGIVGAAAATTWLALLGLAGLMLIVGPADRVLKQATGAELIGVLQLTGLAELVVSLGLFVGWLVAVS